VPTQGSYILVVSVLWIRVLWLLCSIESKTFELVVEGNFSGFDY
jgi:hypothetical protein